MRLIIFVTSIILLLVLLSIADSAIYWESSAFLIYCGTVLSMCYIIWKTKPDQHDNKMYT